jgi:YD repeat-containing protein
LTTRSSTEGELVAVNDVLGHVLWTKYFLEGQNININDNVIYQDDKSTMLLKKNGKGSSSKRTQHINIRYFCIKDQVDSGEVRIE